MIVPAVFTVNGIERGFAEPDHVPVPFIKRVAVPATVLVDWVSPPPTLKFLAAPLKVAFPVIVSVPVIVQSEEIVSVNAPAEKVAPWTVPVPENVVLPVVAICPEQTMFVEVSVTVLALVKLNWAQLKVNAPEKVNAFAWVKRPDSVQLEEIVSVTFEGWYVVALTVPAPVKVVAV